MRHRKLNDFIRESPFQVFTGRVKRKDGKRGGKFLYYKDTVKEWADSVKTECKKEPDKEKCERDLLIEDLPEYCIFGKTCVRRGTQKEVESRKKEIIVDEIPDDSYYITTLQEITEEELEYIF
ncbi:MAG: hypothetical protein HS129_09295 [Leptospiraceae bacterium]|nr:hypothetical protein [Leptospiraceae bacterium]